MNLIAQFDLTTPALIFPAISLLMLAYTNRFVVLAELIRDLAKRQSEKPQEENLAQISNLQYRMDIIKRMQILGALSFISAILSMIAALFNYKNISSVIFFISLLFLIGSLIYLLRELTVSIDALTIQLDDVKKKSKNKSFE